MPAHVAGVSTILPGMARHEAASSIVLLRHSLSLGAETEHDTLSLDKKVPIAPKSTSCHLPLCVFLTRLPWQKASLFADRNM